MNEGLRPPESAPREVTREEAMAAYHKFVEQGVASPDNLDPDDPAVQEANRLFDEWRNQEMERAGDNPELSRRANLSVNMFYVDAGFTTDPSYLADILEYLGLDMDDVTDQKDGDPDDADRAYDPETKHQIAAAMDRVSTLLERAEGDKS